MPGMDGRYLGYVQRHDSLFDFLSKMITDRLGIRESNPAFRVFRLSGSNEVYAYEEKRTGARMICKFYGRRFGWDRDKAASTAYQEYQSLETLRGYDLVGSPHHVIRPLGFNQDINCVIALEYYDGEQFSHAIGRSIRDRDDPHLFRRLTSLAYFLATQHNRTANGTSIDFDNDCQYFDTVVGRLRKCRRLGSWDVDEFFWLRDRWRERSQDVGGPAGLATRRRHSGKFLFGSGLNVGAIDLERMKRGDRVFDVGRVAGELQHAFMLATGDPRRAERFISHFLWEYSCHFPDRQRAFKSITARTPYYMGLNLLRIARNDYISDDYSGRLVEQAKVLLRVF